MAAARTITIETFISQVNYELRNTAEKQYVAAEMLVLYNKAFELLYGILAGMNSEYVATGSGTFDTVAGTEVYSLTTESMGDLWLPFKVDDDQDDEIFDIYLTDSGGTIYPQLPTVEYVDRMSFVISGTTARQRPENFYLFADDIGLLPVPDAIYTVTLPKYIPNFVPAATDAENMPFHNLFNQQIGENIKLMAKNRNNDQIAIEPQMMEIFQDRATEIVTRRRKKAFQLTPRLK